jgi:serine/threonine protein kinase
VTVPDTASKMTVVNRKFTAPEVFQGAKPHPVSELYALGKSMVYLLGGDIETDDIPKSVAPKIVAFLRNLLIKDPRSRAHDAWHMHAKLQKLRQQVFGAKHEGLPLYV